MEVLLQCKIKLQLLQSCLPQIRKWQCSPLYLASCGGGWLQWLGCVWLYLNNLWEWEASCVCVCVCVCLCVETKVKTAIVLSKTGDEYFSFTVKHTHTHTHTDTHTPHTAACLLTFHLAARQPIHNKHANEMGESFKSWSAGSEWRVE